MKSCGKDTSKEGTVALPFRFGNATHPLNLRPSGLNLLPVWAIVVNTEGYGQTPRTEKP